MRAESAGIQGRCWTRSIFVVYKPMQGSNVHSGIALFLRQSPGTLQPQGFRGSGARLAKSAPSQNTCLYYSEYREGRRLIISLAVGEIMCPANGREPEMYRSDVSTACCNSGSRCQQDHMLF